MVATGKNPDTGERGPAALPGAAQLARRRLLVVAAGGVMVGVAAVAGQGRGSLVAGSSLDRQAHRAPPAPPRRPAHPAPRTPRTSAPAASRQATTHTAKQQTRTVDTVSGQPMYSLDDGPKVIALTIDDGPSPVYTPQVLRLLERYGITASFSMIGQNVRAYPAVAREVADAGHTIVNHTWNHANLPSLAPALLPGEISRATDAIRKATGKHPQMFRAPYGAWSRAVLEYCVSERLAPLDWSVDPRDWSRPGVSEIVRTIMGTTKTGSIILEHDGGGDRSQTVAALQIALPRLLDEGYRFAVP